ncbi:MAG: stage II sporulation protein M [Acidobacteriota bacterium]
MTYARFVELRQPLWDEFETALREARRRPSRVTYSALETIAFQYRQILHDHALASSRYPQTGAAIRLQNLALDGMHWVHWDRGDRIPGVSRLFWREFPSAFRKLVPYVVVVVFAFLTASLFGIALAVFQPAAGTAILGPGTIDELSRGHLWTESLTTTIPPSISSSAIATNNMSVAIVGWAGGAAAGLGALYVVLLNGFILGAVFGITMYYSLGGGLSEFVVAHGPLEITLILVTAAAGVRMGRALVEATDVPRRELLHSAGRDALVVLLGCLPWFLLLGLVESYISPSDQIPLLTKAAAGASLEVLFLTFAWNPFLPKEAQ